jgi:hypothetical protein
VVPFPSVAIHDEEDTNADAGGKENDWHREVLGCRSLLWICDPRCWWCGVVLFHIRSVPEHIEELHGGQRVRFEEGPSRRKHRKFEAVSIEAV